MRLKIVPKGTFPPLFSQNGSSKVVFGKVWTPTSAEQWKKEQAEKKAGKAPESGSGKK